MKYVSIVDAKEKLDELITTLNQNPREEIFLTFGGKPIIKMSRVKEDLPPVEENYRAHKPDPRRIFGIAKGTFTFDDELFDALDAEIWREVADSYEVKK